MTITMRVCFVFRSVGGYETVCFVFRSVDNYGYETVLYLEVAMDMTVFIHKCGWLWL